MSVDMAIYSSIQPLVHDYGLFAVFLIVMLESAGLPLPGETALILASICAGMTGDLGVFAVIAVAATGAIVGDNLGYFVGRHFGLPLLQRRGHLIGLDERRLRFGQHMFDRHGAKIVFFGRFVAFLRIFAALLAGVNRYSWRSFMFYNAAGGIVWATALGLGAYVFGDAMNRVAGPLGLIGFALAVVAVGIGWKILRAQEKKFESQMAATEA